MKGKPKVTLTASPNDKTLYRNHRLIVITGDDRVKLATRGAQKNRIRRERPLHIDIIDPAARFDRRHDLRSLFDSEQSAFSSVRIQGRDRKSRTFDAPTLQLTMRQVDDLHDAIAFDQPDRFRERNVRRQQNDAQVRGDKRHRILLGAGEMSEKLRVTGKTVTAEKQCALINRRRRDRIDASGRTQLHRRFDVTSRSFSRRARLDAGLDEATDVVEMIDDGFGELFGKRSPVRMMS